MKSHRRLAVFAPLFFLCCVLQAVADVHEGAGRHSKSAALFSEEQFSNQTGYLADDALEGRGTGQAGIDLAADYIAARFEELGLQPAGDDGTYFQNFTLKIRRRVTEQTFLASGIGGSKLRTRAELNEDFIPLPFSSKGSFRGDVVFAGYGLESNEPDYNDYEGLEVDGKVVLILRRAPGFAEFSAADKSFAGKAQAARTRGAAALLIVNPIGDDEGDALYDFDSAGGGSRGPSYGITMIHLRRNFADRLLSEGGLGGLKAVQERIERGGKPCSKALSGVSIKGLVEIEPIDSPARNVVGMIPGSGPNADEIIILGAHYDHLGIRNKGQADFNPQKDISNGADDNASGTSLVMSLADAYTRGPRPNRSLLCILFTGEEMGLLGSAHFAGHPTIDLSRCVTMFNFDMVGRLRNNRLEVAGLKTGSGFQDMVKRLAEPYGLLIKDGGGGRGPSDHTSFYNKNIPVLFFFTGLHAQYHQPQDDTPLLNMPGAIRVGRLVADCIDELDAAEDPPVFKKDSRGWRTEDADEAAPRGPRRPMLGIMPAEDSGDEPGVVVGRVIQGSAAERAGMKVGDRITRIGDSKISGMEDLFAAISKQKPGGKTEVEVRRGAEALTLTVQFGEADGRGPARRGGPDDGLDAYHRAIMRAVRAQFTDQPEVLDAVRQSMQRDADSFSLTVEVDDLSEAMALWDRVAEALKDAPMDPTLRFRSDASFRLSGETWQPVKITLGAERIKNEGDSPHGEIKPPKARNKPPAPKDDPHAANPNGDDDESEAQATMPGVRLGIMPSYGESEGEGYEISGVSPDGPAAKAGMKDGDRIMEIGGVKITNVYEYMDSLRKYKPGDEVPVVVLRGAKRVTLQIKAAGPKEPSAE